MAENIEIIKGVNIRDPYDSELSYFKKNPTVSGMATEDNKVILNPYSGLNNIQKRAVAMNEAVRVLMKNESSLKPNFALTEEQKYFLDSNTYKDATQEDRQATIAARIFSGDSSAGEATKEQIDFVEKLKKFTGVE
jgi:hypothetical protein